MKIPTNKFRAIRIFGLIFSIIFLGFSSGCTVPNPKYCDEDEDCAEGKYCDLAAHRCAPSICGNEALERGEDCDGSAMGTATCADIVPERPHGQLACTDQCTYDTSGCHTCGNNEIESGEQCDGTNLSNETCQSIAGKPHGDLACTNQCTYDTSACHTCGDGAIDGPEECDSQSLAGQTCVSRGFTGGTLACTATTCTFDETECYRCGDGVCNHDHGEDHVNCQDDCGWSMVSAGGNNTCGLKNDGTAWCWGPAASIGDGGTQYETCSSSTSQCSLIPRKVLLPPDAIHISTGGSHACAIRSDGSAWCWGLNFSGQLGNGTTEDSTTPVQVNLPASTNMVTVSTSPADIFIGGFTCGRTFEGPVYCWGSHYGNLPVPVGGIVDVLDLSCGIDHICVIDSAYQVQCWGLNVNGQLGDGTTNERWLPNYVVDLGDSILISAGVYYSCVVETYGMGRCWGSNEKGQLGNNSTTDSLVPVLVDGTGTDQLISISTGTNLNMIFEPFVQYRSFDHTCGLTTDGRVKCWGYNEKGQLGCGDTMDRLTPRAVSGLSNAIAISTGSQHTCALTTNGTIGCWGYNGSGALGNGTIEDSLTPTEIIDPY